MVEVGILHEDESVELIDGALLQVPRQKSPLHSTLTAWVRALLERALDSRTWVRSYSPVVAGPCSLPEPDIAVVRGELVEFMDRHPAPSDLVLVAEISVTSQALDTAKAAIYAGANIERYWQIDVPARRVRIYTDPADGEYRTIRIATDGDELTVDGHGVAVRDLLPPPG